MLNVEKLLSESDRRALDLARTEGRAEGEAKALLKVLSKRGVIVPHDARERILGCRDLELLEKWLDRALAGATLDELFA